MKWSKVNCVLLCEWIFGMIVIEFNVVWCVVFNVFLGVFEKVWGYLWNVVVSCDDVLVFV